MQLTSLEQQHTKTQETLKEKEKELEKLRAQLKSTQGSLEEEIKKLKGQVTELQEAGVKKVSSIFKLTKETCIVYLLSCLRCGQMQRVSETRHFQQVAMVAKPSFSVYKSVTSTLVSRQGKKVS